MGQGWAPTLTVMVSLCLNFNSKEFSCYFGEVALWCDAVTSLPYRAHNCANGWHDLNTHSIRVEVGKQLLPPQPQLPPRIAQLHPSGDAFFLPIEIVCMLMHFWELAFASALVIGDWSASSGFMEKSPLREQDEKQREKKISVTAAHDSPPRKS